MANKKITPFGNWCYYWPIMVTLNKTSTHHVQITRISLVRVFNALGLKHDGAFAECPECGQRSLRYLQNANKAHCAKCYKRPLSNIDLIMRVKGVSKKDALSFLNNLHESGNPSVRKACATTKDVCACANWFNAHGNARKYIEAHHNHKNKFRIESISVLHAIILAIIYDFGDPLKNAPAGLTDMDTAKWAEGAVGLVIINNKRIKEIESFVRNNFYLADIKKLPVYAKHGSLFCFNRNILIPFKENNIVVGLAAVDVLFKRDAIASITPYARFPIVGADKREIANEIDGALKLRRENNDTWLKLEDDFNIQVMVNSIALQESDGGEINEGTKGS